jgi:hypothetical protein
MKFAAFPKFVLLAALAGACALSGCGSLGSPKTAQSDLAPTAGNWSFVATSTVVSGQVSHIGGNLTLSGNNVSSTMHTDLLGFDCSLPFTFSGTLQNQQITFTSPANANNQVITVIASVTSPSTITGTYAVSAGGGYAADAGNVTAALVPDISGTWKGQIAGSGGPNVTLSMALIQASTASSDGTFALTGNLTYANSSCSTSGTVSNSFLAGSMLIINADTIEQDGTQGSFSYTGALLNNPATPTTMSGGTYDVVTGLCASDQDTPTFTKQ